MLNRTSFSQNITTGLQSTPTAPLTGIRWQPLLDAFQLPTTMRGFLAFLFGLLILAGAMSIHVTLSAEMLRLQLQLGELKEMEARIERQNANLLWQISHHTGLQKLHEEALTLGYGPIADRIYVAEPPAAPVEPVEPPATAAPGETAARQQLPAPGRVEQWWAWVNGVFDAQNWQQTILGD